MTDPEVQPILDYTARDFDTIRSMLVGLAKGKFPEWETVGEANDFGTLLLELYAYMGDVTNFYVDRISSEAFLGTAQRRQSVLYIAEMLGYKPLGQQAATGLVTFTLDSSYESSGSADPNLYIPAGTLLASDADRTDEIVYFETDYRAGIAPGGNITIPATEGRSTTEYFGASKGVPNYEVTLSEPGVVFRSVSVRTKEGSNYGGGSLFAAQYVDWTERDSVAESRPTESVFSTYLDDSGYTHVLFGDGASGRIPPPGASIEITYRYGIGAAANSLAPGTITSVEDQTLPVGLLTVTNPSAPVGGADPETIESMRFSVPKASRIRYRAVTLDDYSTLALQIPGVAKAVAYGEVYTSINVRIAPVGGDLDSLLMESLREDVEDYLRDKVLIGSSLYVEDAQWEDFWIEFDLFVLDGFNQDQVNRNVQAAVEDYFSFANQDFGARVSVGEIYRKAMNVEGVDYIDVTTMRTELTTGVDNRLVAFNKIPRIHPPDYADYEPIGDVDVATTSDSYGLVITAYGGLSD